MTGGAATTIAVASETDLAEILDWLHQEADEDGNTFHSNRDMIVDGQAKGVLYVLKDGGEVVAFAQGAPGVIDIFETRPGLRRRGYGRTLAKFCLGRAAAADMAVIEGECAPPTSLPFWQAMGFEQIPTRHGHNPWVLRRLTRAHELPAGATAEVVVRTFGEEVLYRDAVTPLHVYRPQAVRAADGRVYLAERVVLHEPAIENGRDLAVEIIVDGVVLARDKAKRAKLEAIGVRHDRFRQYYLDVIDRAGDAED